MNSVHAGGKSSKRRSKTKFSKDEDEKETKRYELDEHHDSIKMTEQP